MELEELLSRLDIESPHEFEYFEHFADLLECEESISHEAFHSLLSQVNHEVLPELIENYFEDVSENLPDDTTDIYTLLYSIKQSLTGFAQSLSTEEGVRRFIDELYKFHNWYSLDTKVICLNKKDGSETTATISEALAMCRMEKLSDDSYQYDFDQCLDYELDEYTMTFSVADSDAYEEDLYPDESVLEHGSVHDHGHDHSHFHFGHSHHGHGHCDDPHCNDPDCSEHGRFYSDYDSSGYDELTSLRSETYADGLVDPYNPVIDGEYDDDDDY